MVLTAVESQSPTAWVWDCRIRSTFAANGAADHKVSYLIQNAGSRQIRLQLPAGLSRGDLHGLAVNNKPVAALIGTDPAGGEVAVDLPGDLKFVTLEMQITTHAEPLGFLRRVQPPLPEIGLPVFARRWQLELPPGYSTCSFGGDSQAASFDLGRRLLGCLGRRTNQTTFNPLRREDWQSLFPWRKTEDRTAAVGTEVESAGGLPSVIDLADGTSTVLVVRRAVIETWGWIFF